MSKLNLVDLFSCGGGVSTGFTRTGRFQSIGAADLEVAKPSYGVGATNCNATYERNLGLRPMSADLAKVGPSEIASHFGFARSDVDVLISCAPCTGFSQKQSRNHTADDPRNSLVRRTALFAEAWRPRYIFIENVKELLRGRHKHHFQGLHSDLVKLGYDVFYEVHNLSDFGLPQNRIRSLIVAKLGGSFQPKLESQPGRTVRDAIGHLPPLSAGETHPVDEMHTCPKLGPVNLERIRAIPHDGGSWTDLREKHAHLLIPSMNRKKPGSFPDIYGRLAWDRPSPTITRECAHPGNGRYSHPEQDRLLSVREMALLQGFPEDFVFEGTLSSKYRQIGDAVPPAIAEKIAYQIAQDADGKWNPVPDMGNQFSLSLEVRRTA